MERTRISNLVTLEQTKGRSVIAEIARGRAACLSLFSYHELTVVYMPKGKRELLDEERGLAMLLGNGSLLLGFPNNSKTDALTLTPGEAVHLARQYEERRVYLATATDSAFFVLAKGRSNDAKIRSKNRLVIPSEVIVGTGRQYTETQSTKELLIKQEQMGQMGQLEAQSAQFNLITLMQGQVAGNHKHQIKWEVIGLVSGELRIAIEGPEGVTPYDLAGGDIAFLPQGYAHAIKNKSPNDPAHYFELAKLAFDPTQPRFDVELLERPLL